MITRICLLILVSLAMFAQEAQSPVQPEPAPPSQPTPAPAPACPEPSPGVEITITISWAGMTVPIKMPAQSNGILNTFVAELCDKYKKDVTGVLTGTVGTELPQGLWSINLIVETYVDMVNRIIARDPKKYAPQAVKDAVAEAEAKLAEARAAQDAAAKDALQITAPE